MAFAWKAIAAAAAAPVSSFHLHDHERLMKRISLKSRKNARGKIPLGFFI
jgi:hypothetical protein